MTCSGETYGCRRRAASCAAAARSCSSVAVCGYWDARDGYARRPSSSAGVDTPSSAALSGRVIPSGMFELYVGVATAAIKEPATYSRPNRFSRALSRPAQGACHDCPSSLPFEPMQNTGLAPECGLSDRIAFCPCDIAHPPRRSVHRGLHRQARRLRHQHVRQLQRTRAVAPARRAQRPRVKIDTKSPSLTVKTQIVDLDSSPPLALEPRTLRLIVASHFSQISFNPAGTFAIHDYLVQRLLTSVGSTRPHQPGAAPQQRLRAGYRR
ncbi:hypothetical protein ATK30_8618 [Amycolatopsis echigonensis]|uniref:Uncharacterized protein n=1 Tax=Amycolatopsis echigonensis TaxID=2576905 RepID=A0A2N3WUU1_9PSEU|nr:hypothetical protein ATK30_8618 [Amycolatopsis niigatensis]